MGTEKTFKIGELSRAFHIGVDSIRCYEKVGILNPIRNPENNYRFYTMEDFRRLALIRELLGLGFSTEQIRSLITDRTVAKTQQMLSSELSAIDDEINRLRYVRQNLENRLETITDMEARYHDERIEELHLPARNCIMIHDAHLTDDMVDYYLIDYMNQYKNYVGTIGVCDCYTLDLPGSNPDSSYYRTKNVFFYSDSLNKKECNYTLPEGIYLSILYRGPLTKTKKLLPSLYDYAKKNGYTVTSDPVEFCYIDEYETSDEAEYLIEIQLPVEQS